MSDEIRGSEFEVRGLSAVRPRTSNLEPRTLVWLIAAVVIAAVVLTVAYQVRPTYRIAVGNAAQDTALARGFYEPERQAAADGGAQYRWARENGRIVFPGIGRGAVHLDLVLSRSLNPSHTVRVLANGGELGTVELTPVFATYGFDVPASFLPNGSLEITLQAKTFTPPGEQRALGVAVNEIIVRPVGHGLALPPARFTLSLWLAALATALALLLADFSPLTACFGSTLLAASMAAFLLVNRLFLTVNTGGLLRASLLLLVTVTVIRFLLPPLCRHLALPTSPRDLRWLALIAGATLALRLAGMLHPSIVIVDLKFHLHRLADVADNHMLLLPIQSAEFGGRTVLYAPTPYLVMLPFSLLIHNRTLLLFLFSLTIDALRFCFLWFLARRVTNDLLTANLVVLTMALMPVGWVVYSWGVFANIFAEGMLTVLFVLLMLDYERLVGTKRWVWCGIFAGVIGVTLLAHIGVFVLTAATVMLYLLGRVVIARTPRPPSPGGKGEGTRIVMFALAAAVAAAVAFGLFYRFPARDLVAERNASSIEVETTQAQPAPASHRYRTGGATPDDRLGLPGITTTHLSVALAVETWETSYAFYRVWPVVACVAGIVVLARTPRPPSPRGKGEQGGAHRDAPSDQASVLSPQSYGASVLTLVVWMLVAAIMLFVGIVARLYVRYPLFALPAVAFGAGVALAWLVRRAWWGRYIVAALLVFSGISTLLIWYDRIVYAFKVVV